MAFDGLQVSGNQVSPPGAGNDIFTAEYAQRTQVDALIDFYGVASVPPTYSSRTLDLGPTRLIATARKYQRNYQPKFCIRGRNVNAKSLIVLRKTTGSLNKDTESNASLSTNSAALKAHRDTGKQSVRFPTSVSLPAITVDGPGFSHQLRSRSYFLAGDLTVAEMEGMSMAPDYDGPPLPELAWAEIEGDASSSRSVVARMRPKKKSLQRGSPVATDPKYSVSDLRVDTKQATARPALRHSDDNPQKTVKRASIERPNFDSIDSYLGFNRRNHRHYAAAANTHGSLAVYYKGFTRKSEGDEQLDNFFQIKPVRVT